MLLAFFVFLIVFVLYIHIQAQYKKSEDLEVYEMDYSSRDHLQTVCDMKQPVLFALAFPEDVIKVITTTELPVWDIREYSMKESVDPFWLSYPSFIGLAKSDPKGHFFTRKNRGSLDIEKEVLDDFLKPPLVGYSDYELYAGSSGASSPLHYHMDDRLFLYVKSGKISVKMTPWKSGKYLAPICDYENYEFFSQTNPWSNKGGSCPKEIRWLDFEVIEGYVLYIPPWWWYSIQFSSVDTEVIGIRYVTIGNMIAHIPKWARYYMHLHMTQTVPVKQLEILDAEESKPETIKSETIKSETDETLI